MSDMFLRATAFRQNLTGWNLSALEDPTIHTQVFQGTGMDTSLLPEWDGWTSANWGGVDTFQPTPLPTALPIAIIADIELDIDVSEVVDTAKSAVKAWAVAVSVVAGVLVIAVGAAVWWCCYRTRKANGVIASPLL